MIMSDQQIQEDREELLNLIEEEGINEFEFKNANKIFRKDLEIILKSTFTYPAAIHYASEDLQNRKKFIDINGESPKLNVSDVTKGMENF